MESLRSPIHRFRFYVWRVGTGEIVGYPGLPRRFTFPGCGKGQEKCSDLLDLISRSVCQRHNRSSAVFGWRLLGMEFRIRDMAGDKCGIPACSNGIEFGSEFAPHTAYRMAGCTTQFKVKFFASLRYRRGRSRGECCGRRLREFLVRVRLDDESTLGLRDRQQISDDLPDFSAGCIRSRHPSGLAIMFCREALVMCRWIGQVIRQKIRGTACAYAVQGRSCATALIRD